MDLRVTETPVDKFQDSSLELVKFLEELGSEPDVRIVAAADPDQSLIGISQEAVDNFISSCETRILP
jgi:superfamily I DNA/RNA helicase